MNCTDSISLEENKDFRLILSSSPCSEACSTQSSNSMARICVSSYAWICPASFLFVKWNHLQPGFQISCIVASCCTRLTFINIKWVHQYATIYISCSSSTTCFVFFLYMQYKIFDSNQTNCIYKKKNETCSGRGARNINSCILGFKVCRKAMPHQ
jgi:hypothetical protein